MASTIRVLARAGDDGVVDVKSLIQHPMDSGFVKDAGGKLIPPHYIEVVTFKHQGQVVFVADWGPGVSKDPFLAFRFRGGKKGDKLDVHWVDNEGQSDSASAVIM